MNYAGGYCKWFIYTQLYNPISVVDISAIKNSIGFDNIFVIYINTTCIKFSTVISINSQLTNLISVDVISINTISRLIWLVFMFYLWIHQLTNSISVDAISINLISWHFYNSWCCMCQYTQLINLMIICLYKQYNVDVIFVNICQL